MLKGDTLISTVKVIVTFVLLIMSLQVLLPKDVMVRNFAICLDNEEIPVTFRTSDGPIKERNKETLLTNPERFSDYIATLNSVVNAKCVDDLIDKTKLDANHQVWLLLDFLFSDAVIGKDYYIDKDTMSDTVEASRITSCRVGKWLTLLDKQKLVDTNHSQLPIYIRFASLAVYLENKRDRYNKEMSTKVKEWKRNGSMGKFTIPKVSGDDGRFGFMQVGQIISILIPRTNKVDLKFCMTNVHYARVVDFIKSVGNLSLFTPSIYGMDTDLRTLLKLTRKIIKVGLTTPNGVGGVIKSARQVLFLRGDKSKMFGKSPEYLYLNGLSGFKEAYAEDLASFLFDITNDRKSAINLANIFKIVPHPDSPMSDVFETIDGFKEPNSVDDRDLPRFEGLARKAIYESLTQQRFDIRCRAKDPEDDITNLFVRKVNATSTPVSAVLSAGFTKWSSIRFEKVRGIFDSDRQDIPVSNKSSAGSKKLKMEEIDMIGKGVTKAQYDDIREKLKAINDVVTTLSGEDDLHFKRARTAFRDVIKRHEDFESKYAAKGVNIDDIPASDLENFVFENNEASYNVLTEPKLGEVHKELTRLFYMAQQSLKIMTQVCERFTKKVISKASGISIVKTHRARRKELEAMLYAYTGSESAGEADSGVSVGFISFDMSEFSKKFPQKLIRVLGEILSEISGEDWMGRVDVFFRASIVYHNTRGFVGVKAGVKGGFEGFLNFLWTLGMRVVMDIATQATGIKGILAVFSDDGLLRLYIDGSLHDTKAKIETIQRVFKKYGLIFQMDKTVASKEIFEYLGDFADEGKIIPTWIKEVMSYGKRKNTPGLETVYDRINLFDSQSNAIVRSNGPSYPSSLIKNISAVSTLRRLNRKVPSSHLAALTIVPYSCGGFRTSSITESALSSSIEPMSEFCADVELLSELYPNIANGIAQRIWDNLKTEKEAEKSIITGSLLQTDLIDTSGKGVARGLIEKSSIEGSGAIDPLNKRVLSMILVELRKSNNIRPRLVRSLVMEVPDVIEYNKSVAVIKSSAALRFVDTSMIKRAQRSDTNSCMRSITDWSNYFLTECEDFTPISGVLFMDGIIEKLYSKYSIATMTESPRTALSKCKDLGDITATIDFTNNKKLLDQDYNEPSARFLGAQLTPEIKAETSYTTAQRRNERFVATAARLVASNQSLLSLYYIVANAFRLPCPTIDISTIVTGHRSTKNFGMNCVSVSIPAPYHALITTRMTNKMWNKLEDRERSDRTTYVEAAKVGYYLSLSGSIDTAIRQKEGATSVHYNLSNIRRNTSNPTFDSYTSPDDELFTDEATKAFTSVIVEENAQALMTESITRSIGILEIPADSPTVKAIFLSKLEKWLYSSINGSFSGKVMPTDVPDGWKEELFIEACVSIGFKISTPLTRRNVQRIFSPFIRKTSGLSVADSLESIGSLTTLNIGFNDFTKDVDAINIQINRVSNSIMKLDIDRSIAETLSEIDITRGKCLQAAIRFFKKRSVTGDSSSPTVIINTDTFADSRMSRNVKTVFKDVIDSILVGAITRMCNRQNTEDETCVNFLTILKNMIRPSGHRKTPFNKHMVCIQMIKFEILVRALINSGVTSIGTREIEDFRLPKRVIDAILSTNAVIAGRTNLTTGEDMRRCLIDEGVPGFMLARVRYIISRLKGDYLTNSISVDSILNDSLFMHKLLNYVLDTYRTVVESVVSNVEIIHTREATKVAELTTRTPVEDASYICAETVTDTYVGSEVRFDDVIANRDHYKLVKNLIHAHNVRWGVSGYSSSFKVNEMLREIGLFSTGDGHSSLELRNENDSPLRTTITVPDYTLSITRYDFKYSALHNYLLANRSHGGMAVMYEDYDGYSIAAILPHGTMMINTDCVAEARFVSGDIESVPIYSLNKTLAASNQLMSALSIRPSVSMRNSEIASVVLQQAYQRIVGAKATIENDDHILVAIAEIVRGSWSVDLGLRILALVSCWMDSDCNSGRVRFKTRFRENSMEIRARANSEDPRVRSSVLNSSSAVWEWVKMINVHAGPDIDPSRVNSIISSVSKNQISGGQPTAIYNLAPFTVNEMRARIGQISLEDILSYSSAVFFKVPKASVLPLIGYDYDSDSEEEEDW